MKIINFFDFPVNSDINYAIYIQNINIPYKFFKLAHRTMINRNIKQKDTKPYTGDRVNKKSINKIREELEEGITNIDTLLNELQKIKRSKLLIK